MESLDIEELYRAAERSRLNAFESARQDSLKRLQNSLDEIGTSYRGSVTQAQTAARISALGQEEKLAASGLSSGGSYTAPTSGYTETARVASDNNLRSNLNTLSAARLQQEQEARNASNTEIAQARLDHPDAALKELGTFLDPPVGKSGVNHRLRKLAEIAETIAE